MPTAARTTPAASASQSISCEGARTRSADDLAQFRSIECDLLTPYYAALTLHSIDLRQVCNELRQKAGLPELEEMQ